ncbi:MFS transporter, partial [Streptomyces calidiresistens]
MGEGADGTSAGDGASGGRSGAASAGTGADPDRDGTGGSGPGAPGAGPPRGLGAPYRRLWAAVAVSKIGDGVMIVAIPWLTTTLTDSAFLVALMGVAVRLPWLIFPLPAGVWADRFDRRLLMVWANVGRAAVLLVAGLLVWAGAMGLPALFLLALALGLCEVVFDNTTQVLVPAVVARDRLRAANGRLMGAQMVLGEFVGRPVTGLLIGISLTLPFLFDATAAVVSVLLLLTLRGSFRPGDRTAASGAAAPGDGTPGGPATGPAPDPVPSPAGPVPSGPPAGPAPRASMRTEIAVGLGWLWRHRMLRSLAVALAWSNFMSSAAFAVFVLFAQEVLDVGPVAFAMLGSAGAVGALIGSFGAARVGALLGPSLSLRVSAAIFALTFTVTGLTSNPWVVASASVLAGASAALWNVITVTLRQTIIPDDLLGRVNSAYRTMGWGVMPIGVAVGGGLVTLV